MQLITCKYVPEVEYHDLSTAPEKEIVILYMYNAQ